MQNNRFDPFILNDFFIKEHPGLNKTEIKSRPAYFVKFVSVLVRHFCSLLIKTKWSLLFSKGNLRDKYKGKYIILSLTNNNKNAVAPIKNKLIERGIQIEEITSLIDNSQFPSWRNFAISICNFRSFWSEFNNKTDEEKPIIAHYFIYYLLAYGLESCFSVFMKNNCISGCIFSNDHIPANRALEYICEENLIPSIYIQHASVSEYYPDLHFTYSFLDGQDSFEKYTTGKNVASIPVIYGAIRYLPLKTKRTIRTGEIKSIGVAINILDSERKVQEMCNKLTHAMPGLKIIIRAHPNLQKNPFRITCQNVEYVSALDESIVSFFERIDMLISNDSTIHLDAIEFGLSTVKYNMSDDGFKDQYSYAKKGLIKSFDTIDELIEAINHSEDFRSPTQIVQYYDHSFGRNYELDIVDILCLFIERSFDEKVLVQHGFKKGIMPSGVPYFVC